MECLQKLDSKSREIEKIPWALKRHLHWHGRKSDNRALFLKHDAPGTGLVIFSQVAKSAKRDQNEWRIKVTDIFFSAKLNSMVSFYIPLASKNCGYQNSRTVSCCFSRSVQHELCADKRFNKSILETKATAFVIQKRDDRERVKHFTYSQLKKVPTSRILNHVE